ncbi:MAG TPA: hypothetical protein VKY53_06845 [Marinobacter sp.]|nr:hypothetical protein [Marinobacter sp.]
MTTTTADNVTPGTDPTPEQVRRGRRTALLLFAIGFGPMLVATLMFYTGWLNPAGHVNEGRLIQPVSQVQVLNLENRHGVLLAERFGADRADARWLLLVAAERCDQHCERLLYLSRQVNIALGKDAPRVGRAAWLGSVPAALEARWDEDYGLMERLRIRPGAVPVWPDGIEPATEPRILLVDPFGNLMMHYGPEHTGKQMLKDLKHLLKLSQIG